MIKLGLKVFYENIFMASVLVHDCNTTIFNSHTIQRRPPAHNAMYNAKGDHWGKTTEPHSPAVIT